MGVNPMFQSDPAMNRPLLAMSASRAVSLITPTRFSVRSKPPSSPNWPPVTLRKQGADQRAPRGPLSPGGSLWSGCGMG